MILLRFCLAAVLLVASPAYSQSAGEIAFWESVRDSRNPAELQAYLDQYPNGTFATLARTRLAALSAKPAPRPAPQPQRVEQPPASVPSQSYAAGVRMPLVGDSWTYRLSFPPRFGIRRELPRTHVVRVDAVSDGKIIDQLSVDGATPSATSFAAGGYLLPQGVSVFSPYLATFSAISPSSRLGRVEILDPQCSAAYICDASARVLGGETVNVPAGSFSAIKVLVQQSWRPAAGSGTAAFQGGQMTGGRTLTVWYVPEVKRAVKFASRLTVGEVPPVDAHDDLELVSYQLK